MPEGQERLFDAYIDGILEKQAERERVRQETETALGRGVPDDSQNAPEERDFVGKLGRKLFGSWPQSPNQKTDTESAVGGVIRALKGVFRSRK